MSDKPIGLEQAIEAFTQGTPQEQPEPEVSEEELTPEAEALSESEDDAEEQPDVEGEDEPEAEDSEVEDAGEADDEDTDQDAESDEEPSFTLSIEGKEQEVSLSELRDGYLRQKDYTRKTQAVTEQRKALDTEAEQVIKARDEAIAVLEAIPQQLLGTPPDKPDINLMRSDPQAYEEQKYAYEQWHALKAGFDDWRQKVVRERDQKASTDQQQVIQAEGKRFFDAFEDVTDEATMTAKVNDIHSYLHGTFGYQPQELANMIDHRAYLVAEKARRYDALMAGNKPKAELKVKKGKVKPATSGSAQRKPKRSDPRDQARNRFIEATSRPGHQRSMNEQIEAAAAAFASGKGRR